MEVALTADEVLVRKALDDISAFGPLYDRYLPQIYAYVHYRVGNQAVAEVWNLRFGGLAAWLLWAFIHIFYLIRFENKLLVMTRWMWDYWSRRRGARLITGD